MPLRAGGYTPMETLPLTERLAADRSWQAHWYRWVGAFARGRTVLDAGAGTGYGCDLLQAAGAAVVVGFDLVPISPRVRVAEITAFGDEAFDLVLAVDVIEHVANDWAFLHELLRVARWAVFLSTPNWNVSQAKNPYHVREYTPVELRDLLAEFGFVRPLGAQWHDGVNDHRIYVSNHELAITTREAFDPQETWHNQAVLLEKARAICKL